MRYISRVSRRWSMTRSISMTFLCSHRNLLSIISSGNNKTRKTNGRNCWVKYTFTSTLIQISLIRSQENLINFSKWETTSNWLNKELITKNLSTISKRVTCTVETNTAICTICSPTTTHTYSTHEMLNKKKTWTFLSRGNQSISRRSRTRHPGSTSFLSMMRMLIPCSIRSMTTWWSSKRKKLI